jgi:hypothetical protein
MSTNVEIPVGLRKTPDGSLVRDIDGKILFFSIERFKSDIVEGGACFICGAFQGEKEFNDEHVIPNWILKRYKLHGHKIRLPNGDEVTYGTYKVPCCKDCNTLMGQTFEIPISEITATGYVGVRAGIFLTISERLLFNWLALIFLKTHLKDRQHPLDRKDKTGTKIADTFNWEHLHHLHCVARSFYTELHWSPGVLGTTLVFPAKGVGGFDYRDDFETETMLIRVGGTAFVAALTDSGAVRTPMAKVLSKAKMMGALSRPVLREILAYVAFHDYPLSPRPQFHSAFVRDRLTIVVEYPERMYVEHGYPTLGELIYKFSDDVLEDMNYIEIDRIRIAHEIRTRQYKMLKPTWAKF